MTGHLHLGLGGHRWNGQALSNWQLAREYGFTDLDGSQPDWGRYYRDAVLGGNTAPADTHRQQSRTVADPRSSLHGKGDEMPELSGQSIQ